MPGFVVYLYPYENQALAPNPLICLYFWGIDVTRISRAAQHIPQGLRDTLRWAS